MTQIDVRQVWRWREGEPVESGPDELAFEEPLEIRVNGRPVSVTMRTPGHDSELAAGFLLTEGLIHNREDVVRAQHVPQSPGALVQIRGAGQSEASNVVNVDLAEGVAVDFERLTRHVFASSSCGLCGKSTIDAVERAFSPLEDFSRIQASTLLSLPEKLLAAQPAFRKTGGLHAALVATAGGEAVVLREDVGRHNAVDKVVGWGFLNQRVPFAGHILMLSGRASFEVLQKARAAGFPLVAAVSAPSNLAVDFARRSRITLAGFVRPGRLNIYSEPQRILGD